MAGHSIISRLLEKASLSSVGHPYALGAGLDALGSRPHLFRAGLDALHLIRAVILLPGPDLDLLVLSDLFVPVVVGEGGLEQVVTVLLERGVVRVRSEPVVFKDGASGWRLHPLRLIDRPGLPGPGGAAVRAAPVGLCSGIELRGFAVGIVGIGAVLTGIVPGCFVLAAGAGHSPPLGFRRGSLFSRGDGAGQLRWTRHNRVFVRAYGVRGVICRGMPRFGCGGGGCDRIRYMKVVLQRVSQASVDVVNELGDLDPTFDLQQIGPGFLLLVGVTDEDGDDEIAWLAHKILRLRVFEDEQGKMNRSIQDIGGEILSVSQFTLFADVRKGNRPSFVGAGKPEHADIMWIKFNEALRSGGVAVREGRFGAHMRVGLVNDGPVTIVIDTADRH